MIGSAAPFCESSGDVEDFRTGCVDLGFKVNGNRVFSKVPSRYHTGKGDMSRLGQLELYHGRRQVDGMWGGKEPTVKVLRGFQNSRASALVSR